MYRKIKTEIKIVIIPPIIVPFFSPAYGFKSYEGANKSKVIKNFNEDET